MTTGRAENVRYEKPTDEITTVGFRRAAGVEAPLTLPVVETPPAHDRLPWACTTCGHWVPPVERLHTDAGLFHDRIECLSGEKYEALVARYACQCATVELEPGRYDSDDLDRIVAERDRIRTTLFWDEDR